MVYTELRHDLQWLVFVECPYDLVPKLFINNKTFFTQWAKNNEDRDNLIDGNTIYYNKVSIDEQQYKTVTIYSYYM